MRPNSIVVKRQGLMTGAYFVVPKLPFSIAMSIREEKVIRLDRPELPFPMEAPGMISELFLESHSVVAESKCSSGSIARFGKNQTNQF